MSCTHCLFELQKWKITRQQYQVIRKKANKRKEQHGKIKVKKRMVTITDPYTEIF